MPLSLSKAEQIQVLQLLITENPNARRRSTAVFTEYLQLTSFTMLFLTPTPTDGFVSDSSSQGRKRTRKINTTQNWPSQEMPSQARCHDLTSHPASQIPPGPPTPSFSILGTFSATIFPFCGVIMGRVIMGVYTWDWLRLRSTSACTRWRFQSHKAIVSLGLAY